MGIVYIIICCLLVIINSILSTMKFCNDKKLLELYS